MANTILGVYPAGQSKNIIVDHTGPASYATHGETFGQINNQTGITVLGLATLDFVDVQGPSISGNYSAITQILGTGERKTVKIIWVNCTAQSPGNGIPSTTEVTNGTNLSGETIRLMVTGR